jgi:hypothetical protein
LRISFSAACLFRLDWTSTSRTQTPLRARTPAGGRRVRHLGAWPSSRAGASPSAYTATRDARDRFARVDRVWDILLLVEHRIEIRPGLRAVAVLGQLSHLLLRVSSMLYVLATAICPTNFKHPAVESLLPALL